MDKPTSEAVEDKNESMESDSGPAKTSEWTTVTRSGRTVQPATRYIEEIGTTAAEINYFATLMELEDEESKNECGLVGAGIGGGFNHTSELHVMKFEEALAGPDAEEWKKEIENEHNWMLKHKVWKAVSKSSIPKGIKLIDSTWAMKKKSYGMLRGRLNARGFKQVDGEHYDSSSIASPVINDATVQILLTLMIMANWSAEVVDVKGAFLHGTFENGENIYMKVPQGFEKHYKKDEVLQLEKTIYGLKQAAMCFWRKLLSGMKQLGNERSMADPCLYYKWSDAGLIVWTSWIDDNLVMGPKNEMKAEKQKFMEIFECDDVGPLEEYVGCKITINEEAGTVKFMQPVLLQSFKDEFNLPEGKTSNYPATAGSVLTKGDKTSKLSQKEQTKYRSGVGKLLHMMRWSRPEIYNTVRDCSRHNQEVNHGHYEAMLQIINYCVKTKDRGLTPAPNMKWNGRDKNFEFEILGRADSNYATDPETRKSVTGCITFLEGAPVMFKSSTQKVTFLSVMEAELSAGVTEAQDMLFVMRVMESMELKVRKPMILELDNKGAIDLANN